MILYSHPTGNANVRQSLISLAEAELLTEFWTCINWDASSMLAKLLPRGFEKQLARRTFPEQVKAKIRTWPWRESARLLAPKLHLKHLASHETGLFSVDAVYRSLDRKVAARLRDVSGIQAVFATDDGAYETFHQAKMQNIKRIYELPTGYWRAVQILCQEEKEREPEWANTLRANRDSSEKLARKDAELSLANTVLVASTFTKKTLELAPEFSGQVHILPYGAPDVIDKDKRTRKRSEKLRVLFIGSLNQQKGLSYLFHAAEAISNHIDLTIIGKRPDVVCKPLDAALKKYRWIDSLPHDDILIEMRDHDILVLPSLSDGFGLVILEAMSQGLPVITTENTGGPDVIIEGQNGFMIPIRSAEAITEKLEFLIQSPNVLDNMKEGAWEAAQQMTWAKYRIDLVQIVLSEIWG